MSKLDGKAAIVSGAARGLGLAFARTLAEHGASVVMFDKAEEVRAAGERLARETGSRIDALVADVSRREDVERVVAAAVKEHGGVDILVNNAGTWRQTPVDSDWQQTLDDWDFIMDTNFKGVLMLSRACVPHMKGRPNANIINVSTYYVLPAQSGGTNQPHTDLYNASKWALNGFTDAWAGHLAADGVRVNGLAMGAVDTPMLRNLFEDGRLPPDLAEVVMQPEQIAAQMMALIDEGAGGRSGENIGAWVGQPVELPPRRPPHERITGINIRIEHEQ
jgi:NAD(P)-dependent dehydrogenase (short-subunit alcohol dehydrogenase family)